MISPCCSWSRVLQEPQADVDGARRIDHRRGDGARGEAERCGDRVVASLADLRIEQFDLVSAPGQRVPERHERPNVALAAPGLYADPHASSYNTRVLPADAYAALRHPFVRSFAIGRFAAIAGWQMINVAVGWQLYERTGDPWSLGLIGVAELTPVLLFMVMAGNAADRYPRRNIGIFAHSVLTGAAAGLALVVVVERTDLDDLLAAGHGRHGARVCLAVGQHHPAAAAGAG